MLRGELAGRQRVPERRARGKLSCFRPEAPLLQSWEGSQPPTFLPMLGAGARPRRDTERQGTSSEPERFKGLTRLSARSDGKSRPQHRPGGAQPRSAPEPPEREPALPGQTPPPCQLSVRRHLPVPGVRRAPAWLDSPGKVPEPNLGFLYVAIRPLPVFFQRALSSV